jgi:outer membrane protein assembly factor BamB
MKGAFNKVAGIWRSWSVGRRLLTVSALMLVIAGGAVAAYLGLKRPEDVSNPDAAFVVQAEEKPRKTVKTVNWPLYGYDTQRTRYLPTKEVKPPYGGSLWSFNAGKLLEFSPIVVRGKLYVIDKDALVISLDARTGKRLWRNEIGDLAASSPAYSQGVIYAVTLDPGDITALRARDGKVLWQRDLGARSETSPVVAGGKVIVGNESGAVIALDRRTGKVDWQVSTDGNVKGGLALDDGVLYGANYAG